MGPMTARIAAVSVAALSVISAQARPVEGNTASRYRYRWFYVANTFSSDADVGTVSNLLARAAKAGYTDMVLSANIDSAFAKRNPARERRLREIRRIAGEFDVGIVPMVWSVGYGTMLDIDPHCIEAFPVKGVDMKPPPPVAIGKWDVKDEIPGRKRFASVQKVRPFRHYRFSVKVKTENIPDGTFLMQVYRKKDAGKYVDYRPELKPSEDWTDAAIEFNSFDMDEVTLWCGYWGYHGKGTLEVKDAKLEDLGFPGPPVRREGLHRDGDTDWMGCPKMKNKWGQRCCCMANPALYRHFRKSAEWIENVLRPKAWFLSMDEIRVAGTCAACSKIPLPRLLADCIAGQRAAIRAVNPTAEICLWNDMVDVHHNAREGFYAVNGSFAGVLDLLHRDLIIVDWYWEKREKALKEFSSRGFRTIGAGFYDCPASKVASRTRGWAESLNRTKGATGFMYTTWRRDHSKLEEFADVMRKSSRPLLPPPFVEMSGKWNVSPVTDAPEIRHAAGLLARFLEKEAGADVTVGASGTGRREIVIGVDASLKRRMSRVSVDNNRISVVGVDPREAAQGCYRLEDMVTAGCGSVEVGAKSFTRMFSPRMTHSSTGIDKFPDEELDRIARAGMDAVIVYVGKAPDVTRSGVVDMNDLVRRSSLRGLDVYVYAFDAKGATKCDPTAPDAVEQYDKLYGSIVRNAPGLKGMVFVGESTAFPSKLPGMGGFYWNREKGKNTFGFWPSLDWVDWLNAVKTAVRRHRPDFDVVFWTYNWFNAPEKERVELLRRIPDDVSVLVTFDMGGKFERYKGVPIQVDDYSISRPGPSTVFLSEAKVLSERGIRFYSMANSGGRTWDFGGAPYEPAPYLWLERFKALRKVRRGMGLAGLMDSHHFGWNPGVISELAKAAFTEENREACLDSLPYEIAVRRFGAEAAPKALAAWMDWSDAMRIHSANSCDQYGPLRVGPSFPFTSGGEALPAKPKGKWMFLRKNYYLPLWRFPAMQELARKELGLWNSGVSRLEAAMESVPSPKRQAALRQIYLGKYCSATVRTLINFRDFHKAMIDKDFSSALSAIADERENVAALIPVMDKDPSLGREPTMGVVTDREHLEWKLRQLAAKEKQVRSSGL